ncbi:hypothetical protein GCM10010413_22690 [Promicromonospora sukumoe]|uniref:Uncharacterized protein n=1 Tax=Promicromonospora sukumoe TaxID=88382 RepID=A0A7W3PEG8_9MICO|nr:hypothetical protein [Promicromonospora sukumoe]MBA8808514.1 hypothetical protein [Promicromonospora sukumoe]
MSEFIEWGALGQVLVAGVLVGAGIPALFALGLRLLAGSAQDREDAARAAQARTTEDGRPVAVAIPRPGPARMAGAVLCLALVVAAVATGLFVVVSGGH